MNLIHNAVPSIISACVSNGYSDQCLYNCYAGSSSSFWFYPSLTPVQVAWKTHILPPHLFFLRDSSTWDTEVYLHNFHRYRSLSARQDEGGFHPRWESLRQGKQQPINWLGGLPLPPSFHLLFWRGGRGQIDTVFLSCSFCWGAGPGQDWGGFTPNPHRVFWG